MSPASGRLAPRSVFFLPLLAVAVTSPAAAQGTYAEQVREQLDAAETLIVGEGFRRDGEANGWMIADADARSSWTLPAGSWMAVGACDEDCGDLDMYVTASGQTLGTDVELDAAPIVGFTLSAETEVTVALGMPGCSTNRCYVGIRWYRNSDAGAATAPANGSAQTGAASSASSDAATWQGQIQAQFDALGQLKTEPVVDERMGLIAASGGDDFQLRLDPGSYQAVAVCDVDCSDVDLSVFDSAGNLLERDVLTDDVPVVDFTVSAPQAIRFDVSMVECSAASCGYGFRLYRAGG